MSSSAHPRRPANAARAAAALVLLALAITALTITAPATAAPEPRLSLAQIEQDFMCVVCHEPLAASQSPEALQERSVLSGLIAKGETPSQIDNDMVAQYGTSVLAVPRAQGFNVALYALPPALLLAGIVALAVLLPRWRRRARADSDEAIAAGGGLDAADAKRLEEELARYDG